MTTLMSSKIFWTQRTKAISSWCAAALLGRKPGISRVYPQRAPMAMFSSTAHNAHAQSKKVGFIGLGNMGLPMAINLANKGKRQVVAFDLNEAACEQAEANSIEVAPSVEYIGALSVKDCPVIITMLPSCDAVDSVMELLISAMSNNGDDGRIDGDGRRVILDCSTVSPTTSRKWHTIWKEQGCSGGHAMLDAPVSGGVKGATDGTLTFMVGCGDDDDDDDKKDQDLEIARPYLDIMGQRVMHCGKSGTGSATKLCNNLALAAQMIGICEAMNLGEALGVDPIVLANVMNTSTAKCWSSEVNNPHPTVAAASGSGSPASKDYTGGFGTKLMLKDLGLATQVAKELHVGLPITSTGKELYQLADLRGLGDKDFGVLLQFLRGK